jgi:ligand-binding SRPBCC domain-containing protein
MSTYMLDREQWVPRPIEEVFAFFSNAANLELLTPPWLKFHIVTPQPITMAPGTLIEYRIHWHFVRLRWVTEIVEWTPPTRFVDVELRGPYKLWHHTHSFTSERGGTTIRDQIRYALPLGPIGALANRLAVCRDLERIFDYRVERVREQFGSVAAN